MVYDRWDIQIYCEVRIRYFTRQWDKLNLQKWPVWILKDAYVQCVCMWHWKRKIIYCVTKKTCLQCRKLLLSRPSLQSLEIEISSFLSFLLFFFLSFLHSFFLSLLLSSVWQCGHRQSQTAARTYLGGYLIKSGLQECWVNKDQINKQAVAAFPFANANLTWRWDWSCRRAALPLRRNIKTWSGAQVKSGRLAEVG